MVALQVLGKHYMPYAMAKFLHEKLSIRMGGKLSQELGFQICKNFPLWNLTFKNGNGAVGEIQNQNPSKLKRFTSSNN